MGLKRKYKKPGHRRSNPFNAQCLQKEIGTTVTENVSPLNIPQNKWAAVEERIEKLEMRVAHLEQNRMPVPADDVIHRIFNFLSQFPNVKFNSGSIASNIDSTSVRIHDKLRQMVDRGLIKYEKQDKLSGMYWHEPDTELRGE